MGQVLWEKSAVALGHEFLLRKGLNLLISYQSRLFLKETSKNTSVFVGEPEGLDFGGRKSKLKAISNKCLELILALAWGEDDG